MKGGWVCVAHPIVSNMCSGWEKAAGEVWETYKDAEKSAGGIGVQAHLIVSNRRSGR